MISDVLTDVKQRIDRGDFSGAEAASERLSAELATTIATVPTAQQAQVVEWVQMEIREALAFAKVRRSHIEREYNEISDGRSRTDDYRSVPR